MKGPSLSDLPPFHLLVYGPYSGVLRCRPDITHSENRQYWRRITTFTG